ncbi:MAG: methyl-accepting chemotaxis protein [bacterium]
MNNISTSNYIKRNSFAFRIIIWFLIVSLIPFAVLFYLVETNSKKALQNEINTKLQSLGTEKKQSIQTYFQNQTSDVELLTEMPTVLTSLTEMETKILKAGSFKTYQSTEEYQKKQADLDVYLQRFITKHHHQNLLIADHNGLILISTSNNYPVGENIFDSSFPVTSLVTATEGTRSSKKSFISDYQFLSATQKNPVAFIADVIMDGNNIHGYVVSELNMQDVDNLISQVSSDGTNEHTYLVGQDYLLRSDISDLTGYTVLAKNVQNDSSLKAFTGNGEGVHTAKGIDGNQVLAYYSHLGLNEKINTSFEWSIISEIDQTVAFKDVTALQTQMFIFFFIAIPVILLLAFYAARTLSNFIKKPLRTAAEEMSVASSQLSTSSQQLAAASQQNASIAQQLSSGAVAQTKKIQEVSSSIAELVQAVKQVAQLAQDTAETANQASQVAVNAGESGDESRKNLELMKELSNKTNTMITTMAEISKDIGGFVDTITNISEQTNLLALNAAIEAARAGDAGRGFTVVADEVRKLAEESSVAASQVQEKISNMTQKIDETVKSIDASNKQTDQSSEVIKSTLDSLQKIVGAIQEVSAKMQEVAASTQQQLSSSEKIQTNTSEISQVIDENSSGAQELSAAAQQQSSATQYIASASDQILRLAEDLANLVGNSVTTSQVTKEIQAKKSEPVKHLKELVEEHQIPTPMSEKLPEPNVTKVPQPVKTPVIHEQQTVSNSSEPAKTDTATTYKKIV